MVWFACIGFVVKACEEVCTVVFTWLYSPQECRSHDAITRPQLSLFIYFFFSFEKIKNKYIHKFKIKINKKNVNKVTPDVNANSPFTLSYPLTYQDYFQEY